MYLKRQAANQKSIIINSIATAIHSYCQYHLRVWHIPVIVGFGTRWQWVAWGLLNGVSHYRYNATESAVVSLCSLDRSVTSLVHWSCFVVKTTGCQPPSKSAT